MPQSHTHQGPRAPGPTSEPVPARPQAVVGLAAPAAGLATAGAGLAMAAGRAAADPSSVTPSDAMELQWAVGNRALVQMLARSGSVGRGLAVQRNPESAALLTELATPQIFEGPEVDVQKSIIDRLEKNIPKGSALDESVLFLGAIELTRIPPTEDGDAEMISEARLTDLKDNSLKHDPTAFQLAVTSGVGDAVVLNTLQTMIRAKQIQYLRESKLVNDEFKILIEVHYYRNRKSTIQFHKDTLGQTLFVNLNYATDQAIAGPEYVLNPAPVAEHDELIGKTLPPEFLSDLGKTRERLPVPTEIKAPDIPANGVVAFVDEAIHHTTPLRGNRTVSGGGLEIYLKQKHGFVFEEAKAAFAKFRSSWTPAKISPFSSYLTTIPATDADKWFKLLTLGTKASEKYDRSHLAKAGMKPEDVEELLVKQGASGFQSVSIPGVQTRPPMTPLKREMSDKALAKRLPPEPDPKLPRRFFRTWVRAVRSV